MEQVSIRLDQEQIKQLDLLAEKNGISRSEQIREGLDQYLNLCNKGEQGNFIIALPQIDADLLYHAREKLEELKEFMAEQERDPLVMPYINKLIEALVWDCSIRLVEQRPDGLIDLGESARSHDWVGELIQEQQEQIKQGYEPKYIYKA